MTRLNQIVGFACVAGLFAFAQPGLSETIRLKSTDGLADFTGELIGFADGTYTIKTSFGTLTIPASEVSCSGAGCPAISRAGSVFRIAGNRALLRGALPEILDAYSLDVDTDISRSRTANGDLMFELLSFEGDPLVEVELGETDSAAAMQQLISGNAIAALTSRPVTDDEAAALTGRDRRAMDQMGLERVIGLDGLVAVVGADVAVDKISIEDLARIYSGEVTNWSQLGGIDSPISIFTREPGSDVRDSLNRMVMTPLEAKISANVISVDSNLGVTNAVQTFPNSIGVTSFGALGDVRALPVIDACGRITAPDDFTIKTETYPLSSRIYIYESAAELPQHARGLIDFAVSDLGQQVIADTGFIDLRPDKTYVPAQDRRLALAEASNVDEDRLLTLERYRILTSGSERLSTTFRFADNTEILDGRGAADMQQLARLIRSGRMEGKELIFVGLSKPRVELFSARRASTNDARSILDKLFKDYPDIEEQITVGFRAVGYGDVLTSGCPASSSLNSERRVEIWIRPMTRG